MTFCCIFRALITFEIRVYPKKKEFAPKGSKFLPFRVDPFSEESHYNFDRVVSPENVSIFS